MVITSGRMGIPLESKAYPSSGLGWAVQLCLLERRLLSGVDAREVPPAYVGAGVAGTDGEAGGRHLARAVGDLPAAAGVLSVTM